MNKIQKKILILAVASALSVWMVPDAMAAASFPFTGASSAPSQDVIAKDLSTITAQNSTGTVSTIEQVAPSSTSTATAPDQSASFGVVTAFSNPNMSQDTPDCQKPIPEPANCNNVGQCGTPGSVGNWAGFDNIATDYCATSSNPYGVEPGGWPVTFPGPAPANVYPTAAPTASPTASPPASTVTSTITSSPSPTAAPTAAPTAPPTAAPTAPPTAAPTSPSVAEGYLTPHIAGHGGCTDIFHQTGTVPESSCRGVMDGFGQCIIGNVLPGEC